MPKKLSVGAQNPHEKVAVFQRRELSTMEIIPHSGNIYKGRYFERGNYLQGEIFHIRELSTRGDIPHSGNTDLIRCFTRVRPSFGDLAISEQGGNSIMRNT